MYSWSDKITNALGSTASIVIHTILFIIAFALPFLGIELDRVLLVVTTLVSLEAIYLALFIQMTVNRHTESLEEFEEDIEEIHEDVEELAEDIEEDDEREQTHEKRVDETLLEIQNNLAKLVADIERLKKD